ncbi:MAG: hypothetical protein IT379_40320 [Deltaproteobacteria bacterium]|nr:hypothetical protein [Deltaproteobacteria bacterium]
MRAPLLVACLLSIVPSVMACGDDPDPRTTSDGAASDSATLPETGPGPSDLGPGPADAGPGPADAGPVPLDAGPGQIDAGPGPVDSGPTGTRCLQPSDCVILPASCCGRCGVATPDDIVAVHRNDVDDNRSMACADPVACPECAAPPDPYLIATCVAGACVPVNLHVDPSTECASTDDCTLITNECCGCGEVGLDRAVAINRTMGSVGRLLCGEMPPPCPPCVPVFGDLRAECTMGRCAVVDP